ncbi:MAG: MFS transporter [Cryobacterium sp.]|nr:MFS transporter [Oligoflexia bacterium]
MSSATMNTRTASAPAAEFKLSRESKFIIATAVLASLLEIIDTSIVNVAIPTMMGNLGATLEDVSWVVIAYIIANAIILPASAWLGSQFGRRKYYITCILIFTATSVACGLAPNLTTLVIFRVFQGLAGGALLPTSQALIQEQFPREKAGTGSAIYGMSVMIGPTIGPTLGGYLTDNFGWRSIFNINLPLGLLAAFMGFLYIREMVTAPKKLSAQEQIDADARPVAQALPKPKSKIDAIGLSLLTVGIGTMQYVLERGEADGWYESKAILLCTILAVVALPTFVWWELRVKDPIVDIRLFKIPLVRAGTLLMSMTGFMLYGLMFVLPVFMERLLHLDATQVGIMFIPGALVTMACMPLAGKLLQKMDARILVTWAICMVTIMFFLITQFSAQTSETQIFWALIVRGLAMAFLFVPINAAVLGSFRGKELGQVAGLMNLLRQTGGSIGIALMNTLLDRNSKQNALDLSAHLTPFDIGVRANLPASTNFQHLPQNVLMGLEGRVDLQVFIMSFTQMMWVILIVFLFAFIPMWWLKAPRHTGGPIEMH